MKKVRHAHFAWGEYGCTCVLVVLPLCCILEVRPRGGITYKCRTNFFRENPTALCDIQNKRVSVLPTESFMNHKYFRLIQFVKILYLTCDR